MSATSGPSRQANPRPGDAHRVREPLRVEPPGIFAKFFLCYLVGLGIAWIILVEGCDIAARGDTAGRGWLALLWIAPALWGILGTVYFDRMLECGREIIEGYFEVPRR